MKNLLFAIHLFCLYSITTSFAEITPASLLNDCILFTQPVLVRNMKEAKVFFQKIPYDATDEQKLAISSYLKFLKKYVYEPKKNTAWLDQVFSQDHLVRILNDRGMLFFHQKLTLLFDQLTAGRLNKESLSAAVKNILSEKNLIPKRLIQPRLDRFLKGEGDRYLNLRNALGELNVEELQELVYGADALNPSQESLIGQYLARTGAKTLQRAFTKGPPTETLRKGPQKLVIAVSEESFPVYREIFKRPEFLIHMHMPNQGTLHIAHEGTLATYSRFDLNNAANELRFPTPGTLMPHILLKTTEAQRMSMIRIFYNGLPSALQSSSELRYPWTIGQEYSPMCGYGSCTFWVGHLPLGDQLENLAYFAGKVDEHARNPVSTAPQIAHFKEQEESVVIEKLKTLYNPYFSTGSITLNDLVMLARRLKQIWRAPSYRSLSQLLGPEEVLANLGGEYANPGWVVWRLLSNSSYYDEKNVYNNRVPFVFLAVPDHHTEIDPNFDPRINAY